VGGFAPSAAMRASGLTLTSSPTTAMASPPGRCGGLSSTGSPRRTIIARPAQTIISSRPISGSTFMPAGTRTVIVPCGHRPYGRPGPRLPFVGPVDREILARLERRKRAV
jgi:hypothetical protein